jgi:hypothetical protein
MAVMTDEPMGARAAERAGAVVRLAGAVVSLSLVVGVGLWGYRLFVRDVTGIPVVQAMTGPMREAPVNPGGQIALHTGLAVNEVAALGEAAPPEDVLMLAPATAELAPEDMAVQSMAEADEVMAGDPGAPATAAVGDVVSVETAMVPAALSETPMTAAEVLALADTIAAGAAPLTPLAPLPEPVAAAEPVPGDGGVADVLAAVAAETPAQPVEVISPDVPGVRVAYRPPSRPGTVAAAIGQVPQQTASAASPEIAVTETIAAGTALVQLGAYETAEIAAADWQTLSLRFAEFMDGKTRVIQPAESGGESFFRLRATGFTDIDDANRFCAVLIAEGARCIPVVVE